MFERYAEFEAPLAQTQLVLLMLGMGANLTLGEFVQVLRRPRSFIAAAAGQVLVLPWLAVLINHLFGLDKGVAVGLLLVAVMPGGALSKLFTFLGRGNIPLSITLSAFSTLTTIFVVPVWLQFTAWEYVPEGFSVPPEKVVVDVALFLILPLLAGMYIGRRFPMYRHAFSRICVRLGLVPVVLMVVGSLGSGRIDPGEYGLKLPIAIILFCLLCQQLNQVVFWLGRWPRTDRMAAAIEVTMRNMNLALLLYAEFFAHDDTLKGGVLFVILFYGATAMIAGVPLALRHRWTSRHERNAAHHARSQNETASP